VSAEGGKISGWWQGAGAFVTIGRPVDERRNARLFCLYSLVTLVERKSLYTVIRSVLHKTAEAVRHAVVDGLTPYIDWVHTITYDNGREFADHEGMASDLDASIYFAHPYASWERGLNENTNGLIRQYFPKHRDLTTVTEQEIEQAMDNLNHRPRKSLGFRIPYEVFFNTRTSLTVALHS